MTTSEQFRERAAEFGERIERANHFDDIRKLRQRLRTFTELANNEDWLASNADQTVQSAGQEVGRGTILMEDNAIVLTEDDGYILGCLGAAVIIQWNTLPAKLQKELFDNASSIGDLLPMDALKRQIACFLHKHK